MSREHEDEPTGAVVAAMEIIEGLSGDNRAFPPDEPIRSSIEEELTSQDLLEGSPRDLVAALHNWSQASTAAETASGSVPPLQGPAP
jgi:hypothetical protein